MAFRHETYKANYILAVYTYGGDELITVVDNAREFAKFFNKSLGVAYSTLHRIIQSEQASFYAPVNGHKTRLEVLFLPDDEFDEKEE